MYFCILEKEHSENANLRQGSSLPPIMVKRKNSLLKEVKVYGLGLPSFNDSLTSDRSNHNDQTNYKKKKNIDWLQKLMDCSLRRDVSVVRRL